MRVTPEDKGCREYLATRSPQHPLSYSYDNEN